MVDEGYSKIQARFETSGNDGVRWAGATPRWEDEPDMEYGGTRFGRHEDETK